MRQEVWHPAQAHGRGGGIRTHDLRYPKPARYQAAPRPDIRLLPRDGSQGKPQRHAFVLPLAEPGRSGSNAAQVGPWKSQISIAWRLRVRSVGAHQHNTAQYRFAAADEQRAAPSAREARR